MGDHRTEDFALRVAAELGDLGNDENEAIIITAMDALEVRVVEDVFAVLARNPGRPAEELQGFFFCRFTEPELAHLRALSDADMAIEPYEPCCARTNARSTARTCLMPERLEGTMKPEVTRRGALDMQVCVPADWTDDQVKHFAESEYLCGTTNGWQIRREGSKHLSGMPERNPCDDREGFVHIMLDA